MERNPRLWTCTAHGEFTAGCTSGHLDVLARDDGVSEHQLPSTNHSGIGMANGAGLAGRWPRISRCTERALGRGRLNGSLDQAANQRADHTARVGWCRLRSRGTNEQRLLPGLATGESWETKRDGSPDNPNAAIGRSAAEAVQADPEAQPRGSIPRAPSPGSYLHDPTTPRQTGR